MLGACVAIPISDRLSSDLSVFSSWILCEAFEGKLRMGHMSTLGSWLSICLAGSCTTSTEVRAMEDVSWGNIHLLGGAGKLWHWEQVPEALVLTR